MKLQNLSNYLDMIDVINDIIEDLKNDSTVSNAEIENTVAIRELLRQTIEISGIKVEQGDDGLIARDYNLDYDSLAAAGVVEEDGYDNEETVKLDVSEAETTIPEFGEFREPSPVSNDDIFRRQAVEEIPAEPQPVPAPAPIEPAIAAPLPEEAASAAPFAAQPYASQAPVSEPFEDVYPDTEELTDDMIGDGFENETPSPAAVREVTTLNGDDITYAAFKYSTQQGILKVLAYPFKGEYVIRLNYNGLKRDGITKNGEILFTMDPFITMTFMPEGDGVKVIGRIGEESFRVSARMTGNGDNLLVADEGIEVHVFPLSKRPGKDGTIQFIYVLDQEGKISCHSSAESKSFNYMGMKANINLRWADGVFNVSVDE